MEKRRLSPIKIIFFLLLVIALALYGHRRFYKTNLHSKEIRDYIHFIETHPELATRTSQSELYTQIEEINLCLNNAEFLTTPDVRQTIIKALNISFLLDGIEKRDLTTEVISNSEFDGYIRRELLFHDPEVGSYTALLLLPKFSHQPLPTIIGLPGHRSSAAIFPANAICESLLAEGFAVITIDFRAMACDSVENLIALKMLQNGFSLMGMRVYETLLLEKYILSSGIAEPGQIGIMGHSGGSSTANLVVRVSNHASALAWDYSCNYLSMSCFTPMVHCETIPKLARYSKQIFDHRTLNIPCLRFEYNYTGPDAGERAVNFFKKQFMN
ncbi:alpha/beta hydrolase family protein [Thermodesulfobacteriota bacterium]